MIDGPYRASLNDFDSIVKLAEECFPHDRDRGGMLARWPHCFFPKAEKIKNCLVMKDGPKVVSLVEYVDQTLLVEGSNLRVAGITVVCTDPSYRHLGLMTKLLNYCISLMKEEGYAFSDLNGDRQRYGHFGWENAGHQWRFDVSRRSLSTVDTSTNHEVSQYDASSKEIEAIIAIHDREAMGIKRNRNLYEMLLERKGKQVWLAQGNEGTDAYVVADPREREQEIVEFGGAAEGIRAILLHLIENFESEVLHVNSPWLHPLNATFFSISAKWHVACQRMIKIINLEKMLRGFAHQLGQRYCDLGFQGSHSIALAIEGTEQRVEIEFSPEEVTVKNVSDFQKPLTLSDRQMVRLIFGPGTLGSEFSLPLNARFLGSLLPVNFYIWENESV
jgi:predicted acetyltransferase